jgi:hypothetical protein
MNHDVASQCTGYLAFMFIFTALACERQRPIRVLTEADSLTTKHRLRTLVRGNWKAEVWLWGSVFDRDEGMDVNVRLTPKGGELKALPQLEVDLGLSKTGEDTSLRKAAYRGTWQECARMEKRRETTYENGKWGVVVDFPPNEACWEATIRDAFKSDRRLSGTAPIAVGEYLLQIRIAIDGGPKFDFDKIELSVVQGYEPPS